MFGQVNLVRMRDDLINNWEILYSNPEYQPCKKNTGGPVDRASNRQIYKTHFNQVPLLKNLVDTLENNASLSFRQLGMASAQIKRR
jgi:hypothetical protein